jgi:hypothetical protein
MRPDERNTFFAASLGERGIFREKAITGMHAIAAAGPRDFNQPLSVKIRPDRIGRARWPAV